MADLAGGLATAVFLSFCVVRPTYLPRNQILGVLIWAADGVLLDAPPIVAANLLLLPVASWSWRRRQQHA